MNLETLTKLLRHPKANVRLVGIHVIDMVDEVRALQTLSALIPHEPEQRVLSEYKRVGRNLIALHKEGYDTVQAICEHYHVYSAVLSYADAEEFKSIHHMAHQFASQPKEKTITDDLVKVASVAITARTLGLSAAAGMLGSSVSMSSNLGSFEESMKQQQKRVKATIPSQADIARWVERLRADDANTRQQALVELKSKNNPSALQYMAHTFATDSDQTIRATAKRLGRLLYWNTLYYEMERDGRIETIMNDFAQSLGITIPNEITQTQEMPIPEVAQESIADILAKAEARRNKGKRKRKRR